VYACFICVLVHISRLALFKCILVGMGTGIGDSCIGTKWEWK